MRTNRAIASSEQAVTRAALRNSERESDTDRSKQGKQRHGAKYEANAAREGDLGHLRHPLRVHAHSEVDLPVGKPRPRAVLQYTAHWTRNEQ